MGCGATPWPSSARRGIRAGVEMFLMRRGLIVLVSLLVLSAAAPARAAVALTGPGGFLAGYLPPVVVTAPGEAITYVNGDIAPHNFLAFGSFMPKKAAKKSEWCSA